MDEVPENLALHLVFNWDLPKTEMVQHMVRVSANLRAAGYEVIDGYGGELVVLLIEGLTRLLPLLSELDYLVAITNPSLTPHNGKYGFIIRAEKIKFADGEIAARFIDPMDKWINLLEAFIKIGGERGPRFKDVPARLKTFTDELVEWEISGSNVTGSPIIRRFNDGTGELVFRPLFWKFRKLVLEGHQPVAL